MSTKIAKETRDFTKEEFIDWMIKNNPNVVFKEDLGIRVFLISYYPISKLELPDGWFLTLDHTLTNKGNSSSGIYNCVDIFTIEKE